MNRWLFLFLLFWVAICVLCVYSIAYAEIVKEVRVEVKVEKVIKKIWGRLRAVTCAVKF